MSEPTLHPADSAHPEVELIAEHAEGLLPAAQAAELDAHLRDCADCRETHAALLELTELLAAEPDPGPMPEDVADRIDAALAAEREAADAQPEAAKPGTRTAARTAGETAGRSAGHSGSIRSTGDRSTEARPGDNRPAGRPRTRLRLRRIATGLALCLAAAGIGIAVSTGGDIDSGGSAASSAANGAAALQPSSGALTRAPGYEFTDADITAQIQQLVRSSTLTPAAGSAGASAPSSIEPSGGPSASSGATPGANPSPANGREAQNTAGTAAASAPPCVLAASGRLDAPQVQGLGRYRGVPAYALVYPDQTDPAHRWDVFLVQDSCSDPLVLFHQSLPRT